MDKIKDFFDDFTFHARVMPIIVLLIPIVIIAIFKGIVQDSWFENVVIVFLSLTFLTMTSKIARNLGKEYEKKMYKQLGGIPTTIVLRFSDQTFDEVTKQRYHKKLNQFEGLALPSDKSSETVDDDQQYISATNILRNYANSNRNTELRVYQELKEYNFWRNLYGAKRTALCIYLIIFIREIIVKGTIDLKQIFLHPYPDYIALIITILSIGSIIFYVNKKSVEQKGFDYAKALIEVCERIPTNISKEEKV
ncbi:hypothetical protein [Anaerotruncus rubiinfantis]|uniref:hypothetical protein n=1 Tax=Anaerotruncus rubiinfantis TaxID=1720200 RepID=UPI0034A40E30